MTQRIVFDTTVVLSALAFQSGQLAWLRSHWRQHRCVPLASRETIAELVRVLAYRKFAIKPERQHELLADYLPYCEIVETMMRCPLICRDIKDQPFLDLAQSGRADGLVSGDRDLLVLAGKAKFVIESPEQYRRRVLAV